MLGLASVTCLADTVFFKDGTQKKVRIYKSAEAYVSYLCDGKIEVVPRDKIKEIKVEGEPLTEKELAEALEKFRDELKKRVKADEQKSGVKPVKDADVKIIDAKDPGKGVKIIDKDKSKTQATELMVDPFPDQPILDKKSKKPETKTEEKKPAEVPNK